MLIQPSQTLPLILTLESRSAAKYPRARILDNTGAAVGAWINASAVVGFDGRYFASTTAPATAGIYTIIWEVYDDSGYSTLSADNGPSQETLSVHDLASLSAEDIWTVSRTTSFGSGSMGNALICLLGSVGKANMRIDKMTYAANGFLESAKLRVFASSAAAAASTSRADGDNGLESALFEITLTGTSDGDFPTLPSTMLGVATI